MCVKLTQPIHGSQYSHHGMFGLEATTYLGNTEKYQHNQTDSLPHDDSEWTQNNGSAPHRKPAMRAMPFFAQRNSFLNHPWNVPSCLGVGHRGVSPQAPRSTLVARPAAFEDPVLETSGYFGVHRCWKCSKKTKLSPTRIVTIRSWVEMAHDCAIIYHRICVCIYI